MSIDWSARYQTGETPWEKGEPHPELPFLISNHREIIESAGSVLVPGCGFGHDARLIASSTAGQVVGLDLAPEAIAKAGEKDKRENLSWVLGDLFEWDGAYDLVFEHTCFCAIPVARRIDYVAKMADLLSSGGHLLGIFFLNPDHESEEGPPFGVSVEELNAFFSEHFELVWSMPPSKTYEARVGEGRELAMLWRRRT